MIIYVAGRAKYRANDVAQIQKILKKSGHKIAYDWASANDDIKKPYRHPEHRKANLGAQAIMLKAAAKADVFILLDDEGLRGAYVELGAFLKDCLDSPAGRRAYIVGPNSHQREFVFESPDYVFFMDTIQEVYKDLEIDHT